MFRPAQTPPSFATLVLLTALSVLTLNMFLPSLANIARDLGTSYALASLTISGFLAVNGVLQLIIGPVADRYGRRVVLLWCMVLFVIASVVCALAQSIWVLLAARVVQAVVIAGSALAAAIINDRNQGDRAASQMSYLSMAMALAPMLAPLIGGLLDEALGWRAGFWMYTVLGLLTLWLIWADLGETNPAPADTFFEQLQSYPELFRSRRFWGYALVQAFGVGGFFLFISSTPLVGEEIFGLTPTLVGLGLGSITAGFFVGSFLSGRYAARQGILWMIFAGRISAVVGIGIALAVTLAFGPDPIVFFAGAVVYGFGNGLSVPPARAGALAIRPHLAGSASGLAGALVVAAGAVFTALPGLLLTPENGDWVALAMMLGVTLAGFGAALYIRHVDRLEAAQ